jgi:hypothetical protein
MLTGYEQARSVVAAIAGDWEAARRVELVLPETGVCSLDRSTQAEAASACCGAAAGGPPAPVQAHASAPGACCGSGPSAGTIVGPALPVPVPSPLAPRAGCCA